MTSEHEHSEERPALGKWMLPLSIPLPGPNQGHDFTVRLNVYDLFRLYRSLRQMTFAEFSNLTSIINDAVPLVARANYPDPAAASTSVWSALWTAFNPEKDPDARVEQRIEEEDVLSLTYCLLHAKQLSRSAAAGVAQALLQDQNITVDGWRVKVDRWAKRNQYPRIGIRRRGEK